MAEEIIEEEVNSHTITDLLDVETYYDDVKQSYGGKRSNPGPRYLCPYGCGKLIAQRTIDYHKNNGCTRRGDAIGPVTITGDVKKRYFCCGACFTEFVTRNEFHAHLRIEHDVHPEVHNLTFKNRANFDRFLRWLEIEGGAHFRHKSGSKRRGKGKGIFLACNRSGFVHNRSENRDTSQNDRTGPYRLGFSCTAYVHATEHEDGHVSGEICGDHYGHDARMRLPNIIKYIIAHKQLEGATPDEIIGYLRRHFMSFSHENIYAQRICFIDAEELKAIYVSNTKKWEISGIPQKCEIWEEELLDRAGITREGVPRLREYNEKTSNELAIEENWPRPRVFVAKVRRIDGALVPLELAREAGMQPSILQNGYESEELDDSRYIDMGMDEEYQDQQYVGEEHDSDYLMKQSGGLIKTEEGYEHQDVEEQLLDDEVVDVQLVDNDAPETEEVVSSSSRPAKRPRTDQDDHGIDHDSHVMVQSPTHEIVIVDNEPDSELKLGNDEAGPSDKIPNYLDGPNALVVQAIMEEVDSFKLDVLKRTHTMSAGNMRALLIRFQSLHASILDRPEQPENVAIPVFPNRSRLMYRPGKAINKQESQFMNVRGEVTLLPIEDEMSDDESLTVANREDLAFNSNIWS